MSKTGIRRNVMIKTLVKQCDHRTSPQAACRLVDLRDGREYLVVNNALGLALADYVGEEVEALGTVQEREGDLLISIRDFAPSGDNETDMEEYLPARIRSGHRWENGRRDDSGRNRNRSQTKAIQTARRQKQDLQNWEAEPKRARG